MKFSAMIYYYPEFPGIFLNHLAIFNLKIIRFATFLSLYMVKLFTDVIA